MGSGTGAAAPTVSIWKVLPVVLASSDCSIPVLGLKKVMLANPGVESYNPSETLVVLFPETKPPPVKVKFPRKISPCLRLLAD